MRKKTAALSVNQVKPFNSAFHDNHSYAKHQVEFVVCTPGRVLICASDDRTCAQLKEYIQKGAEHLLNRLYSRTIGKEDPQPDLLKLDKGWPKKDSARIKGKNGRPKKTKTNSKRPTKNERPSRVSQMERQEDGPEKDLIGNSEDEGRLAEEEEEEEEILLDVSSDDYYGILKEPLTVIHPLKGCSDPYSLTRVLHEVDPMFVVLYDAELSFVRQLEIYKASRPGKPLRCVYWHAANVYSKEQLIILKVWGR